MRVFVAGATGALGRHIVPLLIERGHSVTAAGRSPERLQQLSSLGASPAPLDLFDAAAVRRAMAGHDVVVNVATRVPPPKRMFFPGAWKAMDRVRREGSAILADAAIANNVARIVQESFAPIYPDSGDRWINESTIATPARYNRTVAAAEASASRVGKTGAAVVILRYALLYGPGDPFARQIFSSIRNGWAPFFGRRDGFLSMVTQDDAAAATVAAVSLSGGVYNVVDDEPLTREAIATSVANMLATRPPKFLPSWVAMLAGSLGETLTRSLRISNRKLKEASAWAPATPSVREAFERHWRPSVG